MKHPIKPTRWEKVFLQMNGLRPENWYVERHTPEELVVISKKGKKRIFKLKEGKDNE